MLLKYSLHLILLFPIVGIIFLLIISTNDTKRLKVVALNSACLSFSFSLILMLFFNKSTGFLQFSTTFMWIPVYNFGFTIGIDGISLFFIVLTTLLIPLCLLSSWNSVTSNLKDFLIAFLLLDFLLIFCFVVQDLLIFYILFESTLIPMFLIIGIWGSRERKVLASYYLYMYTIVSSIVMLMSILLIKHEIGTTSIELLSIYPVDYFLNNHELMIISFSFFIAFASKVPMIPLHLWLPEAHVEAPTAGSVILAGILLKLGIYGFIKFTLPFLGFVFMYYTPLIITIAVIGIIHSSFTAIRQTDIKRIIAYTSVAHMNFVMLGVFSFNINGLEGAIFQSFNHGLVASGLFLIIGVLYERYHTRIYTYYGGLALIMPLFVIVFLFFTLANISFPGTSSFIGEFLLCVGAFKLNTTAAFLGSTGIVLGGVYSLWLYNRLAYGNLKVFYTTQFIDLNLREIMVFMPLFLGVLVFGICPNLFLNFIHISVTRLIITTQFKNTASINLDNDYFNLALEDYRNGLFD